MRTLIPLSSIGALLLMAASASAVTIDWTFVSDPGNACEAQAPGCFGHVPYGYTIGTYEVTNAQYAEFLNAKAVSDPLGLYNTNMSSGFGGITRSGFPGSFTYTAIAGRESMPVNFVSFYDALRFANWINNGQSSGDTETGAYTLEGGTSTPSNGTTVLRNAGAAIALANEDEWYKAAYYDATTASYFVYPMGANTQPICVVPANTPNTANCDNSVGTPTIVGSYTGSASPYGSFDQGGNLNEWNEAIVSIPAGPARVLRGGMFDRHWSTLGSGSRFSASATDQTYDKGFRVVPEPGTNLMQWVGATAVLALAGWRRVRA